MRTQSSASVSADDSGCNTGRLSALRDIVALALAEDIGPGDLTAEAFIPEETVLRGKIVARAAGIVAGVEAACCAFTLLDGRIDVTLLKQDGDALTPGAEALALEGSARAILTAERTALNFLQRLSGVATRAAAYVEAVAGTGAAILDTRKTTPGLRALEKAAAAAGGVTNHRMGLYDAVMIKDNHLPLTGGMAALRERIADFKRAHPAVPVIVEADRVDQARELFDIPGIDSVLLDNMTLEQLRECVTLRGSRPVRLEASGGVTLTTVRAIAASGVDYISAGEITHSAPALDFGLDLSV